MSLRERRFDAVAGESEEVGDPVTNVVTLVVSVSVSDIVQETVLERDLEPEELSLHVSLCEVLLCAEDERENDSVESKVGLVVGK